MTRRNTLDIIQVDIHQHAPDHDEVVVRKVKQNLKLAAQRHPEIASGNIVSTELALIPSTSAALVRLPNRTSLSRLVNRVRQAHLPANPKTIQELRIVAPEYTVKSNQNVS